MAIVRWILFLPASVVGGALWAGVILRVGDYLVGGWWPTSGLVIYTAAGLLPITATMIGLKVAPKQTRLVKWLALTPHVGVAVLLLLPGLFLLLFSSATLQLPLGETLSRSLTPYWQLFLYSVGYILGVVFAASKPAQELIE